MNDFVVRSLIWTFYAEWEELSPNISAFTNIISAPVKNDIHEYLRSQNIHWACLSNTNHVCNAINHKLCDNFYVA